ncbi:hypothetical protein GCM10023189_41470 [Nibrella saemangeumensis]|uniref:Uncharacterized protein n=1 Tax=Nibrella saemangeumensis TaxID=1084526 RepID=A0ABP8NC23_9BACT
MKVLYDHQSFTGASYGGVSRYFFELLRSFAKRDDIEFELSLRFSNNEYLDQESFSRHFRFRPLAHLQNVNRLASMLNRIHSVQRLQKAKFDIFHPTYYHKYFLNYINGKPFVLTFHDATSERYGHQYPELGENLNEVKKVLIKKADRIISVSEYSKQELLTFYNIDPDKIKVIHLGTSFAHYRPKQVTAPFEFPYLLYVGKRPLYKNFPDFFRAIQPVLHRHSDIHLVCAGGGAFTRAEQDLFHAARLGHRVHYRPVTDSALYGLYQHALAFVFPSLNEGFGIPVLEAFSCGCPAVLSNRSSLPEVGGDAAVYFDPDDDASMADVVERIITDDSLRNDLRWKGAERIRLFSCEKTAQQTYQVYKELV